jgi:hypothetical protein
MKRISIGLVAIIMAMSFAAFTPAHKAAHKTFAYSYLYTGGSAANQNNPLLYVESSETEGCDNDNREMICVFESNYAPDNAHHPILPTTTGYTIEGDTDNNLVTFKQPEKE